ncbi:MAG: alpha-1,2-fucosyltransferase [Schwartzia sp.]|nr:alpha-1,2-fucosyltransferase [Schwartzia sp. (in: firmicutes)]
MKLVYINGGLGNQMFQYMFFYWLQHQVNDECVLDDLAFFGSRVPHNGYELERIFGIHAPRMSERFDKETWDGMACARDEEGKSVPQIFKDMGLPLAVVRERMVNNLNYDGDVLETRTETEIPIPSRDAYFHGYWLGDGFFRFHERELRELFRFPALSPADREIAELINLSRESTAVHVRRGDMAEFGWSAPAEKFAERIRWMEEHRNPQRYFLFSDDIPWCREHAAELGLNTLDGRLVVVEGHNKENAYIDMQLMSLCVNRISDRSSFSLLAGFLCRKPNACNISSWMMANAEFVPQ